LRHGVAQPLDGGNGCGPSFGREFGEPATEGLVVVSKDSEFRDSHLVRGTPRKLLVVATGDLFDDNLVAIVVALQSADLVELAMTELRVHGRD
jgi:predicted nuclease of predicted toxin-antitoxin system